MQSKPISTIIRDMERNIQTKAIVLSVRKYGELHKSITALSPELGLFTAIVYGGRKGKKTAMAPMFSMNDMQIYHNPVKKEYSVVEAESTFIPEGITSDLACTYTASFYSELVTRTPSDDSQRIYELLRDALLALDKIPELRKRITISFIWSLMQISGTAPDLEVCPICDKRHAEDEILYYSNPMNAPCCKTCSDSQYLILPPGARRYLRYTMGMEFLNAIEVQLNEAAEARIYNYMLKWAQLFAQGPLKTLRELEAFN